MYFLNILWFLLPAYFADMAPVFANMIFKKKAQPIDFGRNLFGNHKTYRGFISGIILALLIIYMQSYLTNFNFFRETSIIDYRNINLMLFGLLFGFGSMLGDLIKSFFKRRLNIKPGSRFIPFDQIDYLLGTFLLLSFVYFPGWKFFVYSIIVTFFANIIVNYIGYYLRIRETKW